MKKIITFSIAIILLLTTILYATENSTPKIKINFYNLKNETQLENPNETEVNLYYSKIIPYNLVKEMNKSNDYEILQINESIDPAKAPELKSDRVDYIISGLYSIEEKILSIKIVLFNANNGISKEIIKKTEQTIIISKDLINDLKTEIENYLNNPEVAETQEPVTIEETKPVSNEKEEPVKNDEEPIAQKEETPEKIEEEKQEEVFFEDDFNQEETAQEKISKKLYTFGLKLGYTKLNKGFTESYNNSYLINPYFIYHLPARLLPSPLNNLGLMVDFDYCSTSGDETKEDDRSYSTFTSYGLSFSALYSLPLKNKISLSFWGGFGLAKTTFKYSAPNDGYTYAYSSIQDDSLTSSIHLGGKVNYQLNDQVSLNFGPTIKRIFYSKIKDMYLYSLLLGAEYSL
jgi:hypothetical protein